MDVRPGRPDLNLARMLDFIGQARQANAEIIVFSELCVCGYLIGDLWEVDALVEDYAAYSDTIRQASDGLTVIFGNVAIDKDHIGQDGRLRKYNAVYVCSNGQYLQRPNMPPGLANGIQPKTLQPNYRFFDDDRHFFSLRHLAQEQGRSVYDWSVPFEITRRNGTIFKFGVQLCEDIWCQDYTYNNDTLDTLRVYHQRGVDAVFNLSASPWTWQKNDKRNRVVRDILSRSPLPFFYINQVGAQNNGKNIIVFDGDTTVYAANGETLLRAHPWREQLLLTHAPTAPAPMQNETTAVYHAVRTGISHLDHIRGGENRFLIGVSGGIDSSVNACLLAQTIGPERIFAINTPTRFNADITQNNARQLCQRLGIDYISCPIQDLYQTVAQKIKSTAFATIQGDYTRLVDENIQARIRGADILSGLAAKYGLIFTNNGNKTETALGYATLYGDVNGAVAPIADLYKVQVLELAHYLNQQVFGTQTIPDNLLSGATVPSAELSEAQDVTKGLGDPIKYGYHDAILRQLIEYRRHPLDILQWQLDGTLFDRLGWADAGRFNTYFPTAASWIEDLEWLDRQLRMNYFKRIQAPPIIVLSKRAFGFDLRETQWPAYVPRRYAELKSAVLDAPFTMEKTSTSS
jgi:NAD+ synthase (glutamine-hydrolysing)